MAANSGVSTHRTGYGTVAHRRAPESEDVGAMDDGPPRLNNRRLRAVTALILAAVVLIAGMALSGRQVEAPNELSSAPVLLANMARLSERARGVADSMIAADVSRDEHPRDARITDLASGSLLTPMVNPFPNWKYNVFDPKLPFDPPHHRWSQRRLREEAKRLIGLVSEATNWEDKKYAADTSKSMAVEHGIVASLGNISEIDRMAKAHMQVIYEGLKVAEGSIEAAAATTGKEQLVMDHEENQKKRKVWEILEEHNGKLDWDKVLQQQHDLVEKANIYKQEKMDTVYLNRADAEITAGFQDVTGRIEGMRGRIDANVSLFRSGAMELAHRLNNFTADEMEHMRSAFARVLALHASTLKTANATASFQRTIADYKRATTERLKGISAIQATADTVTAGVHSLDRGMQTARASEDSQMQVLEGQFKALKERLTVLAALSSAAQSAMEEEQSAHSALVQEEDRKMQEFNDAVGEMEPQITRILDMSGAITTLQSDSRKRIEKMRMDATSVETAKNKTMAAEEALKNDLMSLFASVNAQQAFESSGGSSTSYAALEAAVAPISSQIRLVDAMSRKVGELDVTLVGASQNLTKQIEALDEARKKWRDEARLQHKKLETTADATIATTQADMASTQAALKEVAAKIKLAKDFKLHILDVHAQIRQQLASMTQSLEALDQRFSDLYATVGEKLATIQAATLQIAKQGEMKVASDRVQNEAQHSLDSVKDVQSDSDHLKASQKKEGERLAALKGRLGSIKDAVDRTLQKAKKMLQRHPNLFERISCVCYDGDMLNGRCIAGSLADTSTCDICPAGSWCVRGEARLCKTTCDAGQILKGECPAGSVSDTTTCIPAPEGFYTEKAAFGKRQKLIPCRTTCGPGEELRGSCPAGSEQDTTRCTKCPPGFFCEDGVAHECKTSCDDGLVLAGKCGRGEEDDTSVCEPSPAGHYGNGGVAIPCRSTCRDGQLLVDQCPSSAMQDTTNCVMCPDGHYCKGGKAFECKKTCPAGEELTGQCPAGSEEDVTVCARCPEGHFCEDGKAIECKQTCPDGEELKGRCRKGSTRDTTVCQACHAGFFCKNGVSQACKEECEPGLVLEGKCEHGSTADTSVCKPCPADHFCESGPFGPRVIPCKSRCWEGKILNGECTEGSTKDVTSCDKCPKDYYCKRGEAFECKKRCGDGFVFSGVCEEGSFQDTTRCDPCPAGKFCTDGKVTQCKDTCPDGELLQGFCRAGSTSDKTECVPCPEGSFCKDGKAQECLQTCPPGQLLEGSCEEGSTSAVTTCAVCPVGSFCRGGKEENCKTTCPPGKYLDGMCEEGSSRDKTVCKRCPGDFFCVDGAQNPCKETCPDGKQLNGMCRHGSESDTSTCDPCPAGSYCTGGEAFPCKSTCRLGEQLVGECSAGSESDTTECKPCPAGQYCRDGLARDCRTSCQEGQKIDAECAEGSAVNAQCKPCRAGVYCVNGEELPCRATCDPGYVLDGFCSSGSTADTTTCEMVPAGSFAVNGIASLCTSSCPPGKLLAGTCEEGSKEDLAICVACPAGSWCVDGVATPCVAECPNGKVLSGTCEEGSEIDTVKCEACPAGNFCADGHVALCKTECNDGKFLEGECSLGSVEDTTHCAPCPAGLFCKDGKQVACASTCPDGKELIGFCPAGSTEDRTSCEPCPDGHYCKEGEKLPCKTSCDDGELFGGACPEGSVEDKTTCDVCPAGFFCQEGLKRECTKSCPEKTEIQGSCIAGSVTDTVICVYDGTPEPQLIRFFKERTGAEGVGEELLGEASDLLGAETRLTCTDCSSGFVMGRRKMPLSGGKWLVHWYAAWPDYDPSQPTDMQTPTFPSQGFGRATADSITATLNGEVVAMPPPRDARGRIVYGKRSFFTHEFVGDELSYRFDFTSQTQEVMARPFIVSGEVTLLRDSTTEDEGRGAGTTPYWKFGRINGKVRNALDGKSLAKPRSVYDGYDKRGLEVLENPRFLIFKDSQLVAQVPVQMARFTFDLQDGAYTCLATLPGMSALYDETCTIKGKKLKKDLYFSPVVGPGMARVVLTWGAAVKDLDSFMLTPHQDVSDPPCEVNWAEKNCLSNSVQLDKDDKGGGGPETITVNQIRQGRYRYRVSEYKGKDDNAETLKLSEANVNVYTAGGFTEYRVGRDGFVKGNNWYVFTLDGNGKQQPCDEDTCGHD